MAVSNYRAYYERYYRKNGIRYSDGIKEASQLENWLSPHTYNYPNAYYQVYYNNSDESFKFLSPGFPYYGNGRVSNEKSYGAYRPGSIFLGDKYYIWSDFFSEEYLNNIINDFITRYNTVGDEVSETIVPNEDNLFFDLDNGFKIRPFYMIYLARTNVDAPYVARNATLSLCFEIASGANNNGVPTLINEGTYIGYGINWPVGRGENKMNEAIDLWGVVINSSNITWNVTTAVEYSIRNFKRAKYYLAVRAGLNKTTYDGVEYLRPRSYPSNLLVPCFIIDLSQCTGFPTTGFTAYNIVSNYLSADTSANPHRFFILDEKNGGPDGNDPDERDDPYDKDPPDWDDDNGGDGDFDDESDLIDPPGIPTLSGSGVSLFTIFNPNSAQLFQLSSKLWSPDFIEKFKQYFTNPLDAIIGLGIIPVQPRTTSSRNIHLGMYDSGVPAPVVDSDYVIVNCGIIPITRYYGSYLDYDPYTKITCYLPYIGDIDINPDQVMNTNLGIEYHINVVTGDTIALILSDGSVIYTAAGNCMRQLPISQTDYASIINTAVSAASTIASAVAAGGVTTAMANQAIAAEKSTEVITARANVNNVGAGASLVQDVMGAKYNYKHAGNMGTGSGQLSVQKPYLTIERPNLDLADNYKSFVGYPCNKTVELSRCSGFTQIEASRMKIPNATDDELSEVIGLLLQGVII